MRSSGTACDACWSAPAKGSSGRTARRAEAHLRAAGGGAGPLRRRWPRSAARANPDGALFRADDGASRRRAQLPQRGRPPGSHIKRHSGIGPRRRLVAALGASWRANDQRDDGRELPVSHGISFLSAPAAESAVPRSRRRRWVEADEGLDLAVSSVFARTPTPAFDVAIEPALVAPLRCVGTSSQRVAGAFHPRMQDHEGPGPGDLGWPPRACGRPCGEGDGLDEDAALASRADRRGGRRRLGLECAHLGVVWADDAVAGFGHLVPDPGDVAEGFGDDQPRVL